MKNLFFVVVKELFTPGTLNYLINVEEGIKVGVGKAKKNKTKNTSNKHRWWLRFDFSKLLVLENWFTKEFAKIA